MDVCLVGQSALVSFRNMAAEGFGTWQKLIFRSIPQQVLKMNLDSGRFESLAFPEV